MGCFFSGPISTPDLCDTNTLIEKHPWIEKICIAKNHAGHDVLIIATSDTGGYAFNVDKWEFRNSEWPVDFLVRAPTPDKEWFEQHSSRCLQMCMPDENELFYFFKALLERLEKRDFTPTFSKML
jgi:hypothetical protein